MIDSGDEPRAGLHLFQAVVAKKALVGVLAKGKSGAGTPAQPHGHDRD
jgi:hypothetical protein